MINKRKRLLLTMYLSIGILGSGIVLETNNLIKQSNKYTQNKELENKKENNNIGTSKIYFKILNPKLEVGKIKNVSSVPCSAISVDLENSKSGEKTKVLVRKKPF